jgi:CxxC motif-containing protein
MSKPITCIVCPVGCQIVFDDDQNPIGNRCLRGKKYAIEELINPRRVLTTTVRTTFSEHPRLSVKSNSSLPKDKIMAALDLLSDIILDKEIRIGDVIIKNILNTGVDMVATNHLKPYK